MANKFTAKNLAFKAKSINSHVDKNYVAEMTLAAANDYVSDPSNIVDVRKHNFFVYQDEEIPVQRYLLNELKDPEAIELRIRQGHNGKVSLLTRRSNVKTVMTTKRVRITWMFDKNSQFKSILVINAQPERDDNPQLYYSEFCPNKEVVDEDGYKTMPYLTWEKDQIMAWFMDTEKNRGCVLAVSDEEFDKSAPWIRGDEFFPELKKKEWKEHSIAQFMAYRDITDDISNLIQYLYEYEIDKNEQAPFLLNRSKREIESALSIKADPDNLDDILKMFPYIGEGCSQRSIEVINLNKEAFLDLVKNVDIIVTKTVEAAYNNPHCWGEPFDDEDEEEAFQECGPELDFDEAFNNWKSSDEGEKYSPKYKTLVKLIIEGFSENELFSESWMDWIEG